MVIIANRTDVDEEIDRLEVMLANSQSSGDSESIGRRLIFNAGTQSRSQYLAQNLFPNNHSGPVELKVLIEQMREQIQNIECFASLSNIELFSANNRIYSLNGYFVLL